MFKLAPNGELKGLQTFTGGSDGGNPDSVVPDGEGNLYGTAATGWEWKSTSVMEALKIPVTGERIPKIWQKLWCAFSGL